MTSHSPPEQISSTAFVTALIVQGREKYARFWQYLLASQGWQTLIEAPKPEPPLLDPTWVGRCGAHVALVDTALGKAFNPYAFCRDCLSQYPDIKVVLIHPARQEVLAAERRWAIHQGAADLISTPQDPGQVEQCLAQLFAAVQWEQPVDPVKMRSALQAMNLLTKRTTTDVPTPAPSTAQVQDPEPQPISTKPVLMYRGQPVIP